MICFTSHIGLFFIYWERAAIGSFVKLRKDKGDVDKYEIRDCRIA